MQDLWGAAPGPLAAAGFDYGFGAPFGGYAYDAPAYGFGFEGYGPNNWAESNAAWGDEWAAANYGAMSAWDGVVAGQDMAAAKDFADRSDKAWKTGNKDKKEALAAWKARNKAFATADNDAVDAANDYWKANNFYNVAMNDDATARFDIDAAMRATAVQKRAEAVAAAAKKAASRYTKGANKAEKDENTNIKDSKASLKAMIKARKAQAQHTTDAWNDQMDFATDQWNAQNAYTNADWLAADSNYDAYAAANAYGAEWNNANFADREAWAGADMAFAAATPQYYGRAGYGYGAAPFMW